jgi:hypothetical protein
MGDRLMPYSIQKTGARSYAVVTTAGPHKGHKHSKKPMTEEMAKRQMRAIGMNTHKGR